MGQKEEGTCSSREGPSECISVPTPTTAPTGHHWDFLPHHPKLQGSQDKYPRIVGPGCQRDSREAPHESRGQS